MAAARKGLLAILGGGKPSPEEAEGDYETTPDKVADAQAVIDAIEAGDAEMLAESFGALMRSCNADSEPEM
jgi:hypothetical protein